MLKLFKKSIDTLRYEPISVFMKRAKNKLIYLYEKKTFQPYQIEKNVAGERISLYISDLFAKNWYDRPEYLDHWTELVWLKENALRKGDIVVDCGANIGFTGIFFAKCIGKESKVIGFEALSSNVNMAQINIDINQVNNFEIRNQAVGSHNGIVEFTDYPNGSVGKTEGLQFINVPVITLDEVFSITKPTFLKIDVEGYEVEVLKGATEILKTKPKLDIEIHCSSFSDRLSSLKELLGLLPLSEYQIFLQLITNGEIVPCALADLKPELLIKHDNFHLFALSNK
ncbi:FkbM family methyltransferase [Nostoc sp. UHCC 0251]|uniref:FkbM family methyltransferase n=1 Tax=Nostoc sp. UHCC 0251 TaxID=3110240 RepID=UPI002B20DB71|nr:FkbM family methyltransferase [Nostoc sp. UHCC 0251]MEA5626099.1 FkbM family methyltransferase [Nostoc sp. UHCC 0251]